MQNNQSLLRRVTNRVFGGLPMSWPVVIFMAIATAGLTALFLINPIFENTSFVRMGETFEAWILFAVLIMSNCKKPLESALKTFVFFLISQPLIYLIQVPFSDLGWGLFMYYRYWFLLTILTFPAALAGWFITKRSWLSLLILTPVLFYLGITGVWGFKFAAVHFPYQIVTGVFCILQVLWYAYAFTENIWQRLVGIIVPLAAGVVMMFFGMSHVDLTANAFLPGEVSLSENAVITSDDNDMVTFSVDETGREGMINFHVNRFGKTHFTITDGGKTYRYSFEAYEDEGGHTQTRINRAEN